MQMLIHETCGTVGFCTGWWRVSQWELDGLPSLLGLLRSWLRPQGPKASGAPKTVSNPKGLPPSSALVSASLPMTMS